MVEITKETWERNGVEVIVFNGKKWLNQTNIKSQLKHSNLAAVTIQHPQLKEGITRLWQLPTL